jgi:hypothetical protein
VKWLRHPAGSSRILPSRKIGTLRFSFADSAVIASASQKEESLYA